MGPEWDDWGMERTEGPELAPYLAVIREFVTDVLAEEEVPQSLWPPQPISPSGQGMAAVQSGADPSE